MAQIMVPISSLVPGANAGLNARRSKTDVAGLIASIKEVGLLQPLLVQTDGGGKYHVIAGNRRLAALQEIAKADGIREIPCIEFEEGGRVTALEASLMENLDRERLHPVDLFEVLSALVEAGTAIEDIARRRGMKLTEIRHALRLGRMAPEVRDAWRAGALSAEAAEEFAITSDLKAQVAALKKAGKHPGPWQVKRALLGEDHQSVETMLKLVGIDKYEAAGFEVNQTLFHERGDRPDRTVSDVFALRRMVGETLDAKCEALIKDGWAWAVRDAAAPRDWRAWRKVQAKGGGIAYTKEEKAQLGCVVGLPRWDNGNIEITRGIAKPGTKVATPKAPTKKLTPAQKAKAEKERAKQKEETGGLSNALATRLSDQLTAAVRHAIADGGLGRNDLESFVIAAFACDEEAPTVVKIGRDRNWNDETNDDRLDNDFTKYYKLALSKTPMQRAALLASWLARTVELGVHRADQLMATLHPGKGDKGHARTLVAQIDAGILNDALVKHFDAKDYFGSVSKELIVDAVREALGKKDADNVAKMKSAEARAFAIAHVPKTKWLPEALKL